VSATIAELRHEFFEQARTKDGTCCPVCRRYGKVYKRRINATMARALIRLYRATLAQPLKPWFHFAEFTDTRNDYEKLIFWKMIEHKPNADDPTKKDSGYWRITQAGKDFVAQRRTMPEYAIVYDGEVLGFSEAPTTIMRALGEKFSYVDLMGDALRAMDQSPQAKLLFGNA
jgi:hypothetical protein